MGYYSTVTGTIEIRPTVPHREMIELIRNDFAKDPKENYYTGNRDVYVSYDVDNTDTEDGFITSYAGFEISPRDSNFKAYNLIEDLQALVDTLGAEKYSYVGFFEITGEEQGDLWRLAIKGGKAVEVKPKIVWPEI